MSTAEQTAGPTHYCLHCTCFNVLKTHLSQQMTFVVNLMKCGNKLRATKCLSEGIASLHVTLFPAVLFISRAALFQAGQLS